MGIKIQKIKTKTNKRIYDFEGAYYNYLTAPKIVEINSNIQENPNSSSGDTVIEEEMQPIKLPKEYNLTLYRDKEREFKNYYLNDMSDISGNLNEPNDNNNTKNINNTNRSINEDLLFDSYDSNNNGLKSKSNLKAASFEKYKRKITKHLKKDFKNKKIKYNNLKIESNIEKLFLNDIFNVKLNKFVTNFESNTIDKYTLLFDTSSSEDIESSVTESDISNNSVDSYFENMDKITIIIYLRRRISTFSKAVFKLKNNVNKKILNKIFSSILLEENFNRFENYKLILLTELNDIIKNVDMVPNIKKTLLNVLISNDKIDRKIYKISKTLNNNKITLYIRETNIERIFTKLLYKTDIDYIENNIFDFGEKYKEEFEEEYFIKHVGPVYSNFINKYIPINPSQFNMTSYCLNLLTNIFNCTDISYHFIINAINTIENVINNLFLKSKSICKFIFINSKNENYVLFSYKKYLKCESVNKYKFKLNKNKNVLINYISSCLIENEVSYGIDILNCDHIKGLADDLLKNMIVNSCKVKFNFDSKENIFSFFGFKIEDKLVLDNPNKGSLKHFYIKRENINVKNTTDNIKEFSFFLFDNIYNKSGDITYNNDLNFKSIYELYLFLNDINKILNINKDLLFFYLNDFMINCKNE